MLRSIKSSVNAAKLSAKNSENHTHTLTRTLAVPTPIAYSVVADVSRYHEFIPYCTHSFITERDENDQPTIAGLRVGFQSFDEEFECDLTCDKDKEVLAVSTTHSLFYHLHTKWSFKEMNSLKHHQHCKVTLELSYRFKSPLYHSVSGVFGASVSELVMKAFEKRAKQQTPTNQNYRNI